MTSTARYVIDLSLATLFYICGYLKTENHRLPQFFYASDIWHFVVCFSLMENANRKMTSVKLPSNTFSRVILWLALEVLARRKPSATVWNSCASQPATPQPQLSLKDKQGISTTIVWQAFQLQMKGWEPMKHIWELVSRIAACHQLLQSLFLH